MLRKKRSAKHLKNTFAWAEMGRVLLLGGIFFILSVFLTKLLGGLINRFFILHDEIGFNICQNIILALIVLFWQKKFEGLNLSEIGFRRINYREIILSIISGAGICTALLFMTQIEQVFVAKMPVQALIKTAENTDSWSMLIKIFILSVSIAPLSEEIMFRGFIYGGLKKAVGRNAALLVTSLLFGALHFDLYRLFSLTLAGLGLNILREKFNSLYVSMIAHGVWNMLMLGLVFWL